MTNTIQDKLLVGYQGWFTCAGDGDPIHPTHHGWLHWFNTPIPSGGRPNTDLWPDTSGYDPDELYPAPGLTTASGDPVHLFSSRHPRTVRRHFHWMAVHGVDGAFLQRFAGQCEIKPGNHAIRDLRDEIGQRVREAAEAERRVFAIMYDVSGVSPDKIQHILEQDWVHLLADQHLLDSPSYLRERGRPVVALWGFGFQGRNHTPDLVRAITAFFRSNTPGGVYLVAGAPGHWRTSTSDADRNTAFQQVWTDCFDAISPWTVGRYSNEDEADRWGEERLKADAEYLKELGEQGGRKVDYIPVVLPGGSGFNLSGGKWAMNDIRRNGGAFLWRQMYNAHRAGVRTIYGAMWDEYDEGTAFMPVVPASSHLPVHSSFRFVALDVDGHDLPSDWYMRIAGLAAEALHGKRTLPDTLPLKELQDYWHTRPRDQHVDVDEVTRALGTWQVASTDAPPPYSLEDSSAQQVSPAQHRPPPVRYDSRPYSSRAQTQTSSSDAHRRAPIPPVVDMSTHPHPHRAPAPAPAVPPRPQHAHGRYHSSFPDPVPVGYARGRSRSRSRPRSRSRSGSRTRRRQYGKRHSRSRSGGRRSRSRSRSRSRRSPVRYASQTHPVHPHSHNHGHGHGHGHSHSQTHGHGHSLSPVGSPMTFPHPEGIHHAYSEGGYEPVRQGLYTPVHSTSVGGYGYGHSSQQQYAAPQGFGGYGYTPHPSASGSSSSSSYYASPYAPGTPVDASGSGSGSRGGKVGAGLASALQVMEDFSGKRKIVRRVEKGVKTLSNTGSTLLNKLK